MKYTSILAGVFGLMALAACTNNDEVKMEQPELAKASTITVTWGKGADTRMADFVYDETEGIKASWEIEDKIGMRPVDTGGNAVFYKAIENGNTAKFVRSSENEPENNTRYYICYPTTFMAGYNVSEQTGLLKDLKNFAYAEGFTKFVDGEFESSVTLAPVCSFLRIPKGTVLDLGGTLEVEHNFSKSILYFFASDLVIDERSDETGSITIYPGDDASLFEIVSGKVQAAVDIYIAVPVNGTVENMQLTITAPFEEEDVYFERTYNIVVNDSNAKITEAGHIYNITEKNLNLI